MRTAIVSTYPPRACGIGTFAADVRGALLGVDGIDRVEKVVIVNDPTRPQRTGLSPRSQGRSEAATSARADPGPLDVHVVLLQHEYGTSAAPRAYVLSLVEELPHPSWSRCTPCSRTDVPSSSRALGALPPGRVRDRDDGDREATARGERSVPAEQGSGRPHGAPTVLARRADAYAFERAARRRRRRRFVLSTFGLISAGKGIERVIEALPAIVERHPEVVYVIAGRTHPDVAHREGERYRLTLEQAVLDLGLEDHVEFDDRFLAIDEIADLLAATDVFVTPYKGREQIASGALTFGIAAGCGVVSTPYWYAQDMLAWGPGAGPVRRLLGDRGRRLRYIDEPDRLAAARARHGGSARSSPGRRWPRRPRPSCAKPSSWHRDAGGRSPGSTHSS